MSTPPVRTPSRAWTGPWSRPRPAPPGRAWSSSTFPTGASWPSCCHRSTARAGSPPAPPGRSRGERRPGRRRGRLAAAAAGGRPRGGLRSGGRGRGAAGPLPGPARRGRPARPADHLPPRRPRPPVPARRVERGPGRLAEVLAATALPLLVLGRGSNLLVADAGGPGVVLNLGQRMRSIAVDGTEVEAGAGAPLPTLAARSAAASLGGLAFTVAIP